MREVLRFGSLAAEKLDYPDEASTLLRERDHLPDLSIVLPEMWRIMKPGARRLCRALQGNPLLKLYRKLAPVPPPDERPGGPRARGNSRDSITRSTFTALALLRHDLRPRTSRPFPTRAEAVPVARPAAPPGVAGRRIRRRENEAVPAVSRWTVPGGGPDDRHQPEPPRPRRSLGRKGGRPSRSPPTMETARPGRIRQAAPRRVRGRYEADRPLDEIYGRPRRTSATST
jgi:hypothetical protein